MQTNYVIMFRDNGVTNLSYQMEQHMERLRATLTDAQIRALAYIEGDLAFGSPEGAARDYAQLDAKTRETPEGIALGERIAQCRDDRVWWGRVHAAMHAHLGGKTRMSKSGETIIFSQPQCGRHDLSRWKERAQAQLAAAGISI